MSDPADDRSLRELPVRPDEPHREGSSRTAPADRVGAQRPQPSDGPDTTGSTLDGESPRTPAERDESPAEQAPTAPTGQPMRRAEAGAPGVVEQAHRDVERGLQDTDLYGSGNLASPDDKGRRPDAAVDRADGQDAVRRSGHDVGSE